MLLSVLLLAESSIFQDSSVVSLTRIEIMISLYKFVTIICSKWVEGYPNFIWVNNLTLVFKQT